MSHQTPRHRTYLLALVDGGGTVPPELGIVRRLVDRGHHVTVLAEDSMADDVRATGAVLRPWTNAPNRPTRREEHDPYRDWECKRPAELLRRMMETQLVGPARDYATDVAAAVHERRPDLILCSMFAYGAMIAAEAAGIPFDVLMPNAYILPAPGMPAFGIGAQPARGPLGRLRDRTITAMGARQWDKGVPGLNALRTELGLAPLTTFFEQAHRARRQLVLTSADFDFPADVPAHVRYVGPILDDPAWTSTAEWHLPPGDDPLVLVALSSTFQDQVGCLQRIVDALGTLPVRGIVTTGPAVDPSAVSAPSNVTVVAAAPHSEILREAAVVVTHGGHGTVVRTLAAGVPMAILHHGRDQADNAARVVGRGAGLKVRRTAKPERIAATVQRLLADPAYRAAAERLGASIRRDAHDAILLAELESVTQQPSLCEH
jgi:MGT family glycosyltransferase